MALNCRHVMPGGGQCHGYAIQGGNLCFFHRRRRIAAQKPVNPADPIEIPFLEDRCAIQVTVTEVLRAIANNTIDRPRASLLLYGLQLSLQSVDRKHYSIPFGTVQALSRARDGEEIAADLDDEYEDEDDEEEDDDEEDDETEESEDNDSAGDAAAANGVPGQREGEAGSNQDKSANGSKASSNQDKSANENKASSNQDKSTNGSKAGSNRDTSANESTANSNRDKSVNGRKASSNSKEKPVAGDEPDENSGDHSEEEKIENDKDKSDDEESDGEATDELTAGQTLLQSVANALEVGNTRLAARLLADTSP